jgi:hypothetical protein
VLHSPVKLTRRAAPNNRDNLIALISQIRSGVSTMTFGADDGATFPK